MGRGSLDVSTAALWSPSRAAVARAAKRSVKVYPLFDVTPFAGVFLVVLFIFMVGSGSVVIVHGIGVDRPRLHNATLQRGAIREDAIQVFVMRDGRVYFDRHMIAPHELPGQIRDAVGHGSERKIYLTVDRRAKYGDVKPVIDAIQASGITRVAILAEATEPRPQ